MKIYTLLLFLFFTLFCTNIQLYAQGVKIGDNANTIHPASILELEVTAGDKGFLPPRIPLSNVNNWSPMAGAAIEGMVVYSEGGALANGLYYWDNTAMQWQRLSAAQDAEWLDANINGKPLILASQAAIAGDTVVIRDNGFMGIGTTDPKGQLHIHKGNGGPASLLLTGTGSTHSRAEIIMATESYQRATGTFLLNTKANNEFFIGRPYAYTNRYVINFQNGTTSHKTATCRVPQAGGIASNYFTVMDNGNVGINRFNPTNRLHIADTTDPLRIDGLVQDDVLDTVLTTDANGVVHKTPVDQLNSIKDHDWYEVGTTNSPNNINDNIYTQGNVGIGTTTPRQQLDVATRAIIGNTSSLNGDLTIQGLLIPKLRIENSQRLFDIAIKTLGTDRLAFLHNTDEVMSINRFQRVGIGTDAALNKLHIADATDPLRIDGLVQDDALDTVLTTDANGVVHKTPVDQLNSIKDHDWYEVGTTNSPNNINDNVYTMGEVNIGASANNAHGVPLYIQDNSPTGNAVWIETNSNGRGLAVESPGLVAHNYIYNSVSGTGSSDGLVYGINNTVGQIMLNENLPLVFGTNSGEDMRIDATGNVGIGTTTPSEKLHVFDGNFALQNAAAGDYINFIPNNFSSALTIERGGGSTVRVDANAFRAGTVVMSDRYTSQFDSGNDIELGGQVRIADAATGTISIKATDAFASATGTNRNGGGVSINGGANVVGGTYGNVNIASQGGNVGIGTNAPIAQLHVASGGNTATDYTAKFNSSPSAVGAGGIVFTNTETANATGFKWHTAGTGTGTFADDDLVLSSITVGTGATNANNIFTIQGNGNIGLGVLNSANPIQHSNGARLTAAGVWTNASDRRLKENILDSKYGLATVMQLRAVDYTMKKGGEKQVGFIAQEVQSIIPEVVNGKEGDLENGETLGVAYGQMVAVLTKAMQEQQAQIETLKKQNGQLEGRVSEIDQLKAELSEIKDLLQSTSNNNSK